MKTLLFYIEDFHDGVIPCLIKPYQDSSQRFHLYFSKQFLDITISNHDFCSYFARKELKQLDRRRSMHFLI